MVLGNIEQQDIFHPIKRKSLPQFCTKAYVKSLGMAEEITAGIIHMDIFTYWFVDSATLAVQA
jgi:hypothetical protein